MITLLARTPDAFGLPSIVHDDGRTILVQTDTDYPGIAGTFGWHPGMVPAADTAFLTGRAMRYVPVPACDHAGTDGTIACDACGTPAAVFLESAADYIAEHDGATADDPGYWP